MLSPESTFGTYRVLELLGSGAMGQVFRAVDTRLDREVALKIIRPELAGSEEYRQRLAAEAKAAARVDSPYVVRVWEYSIINNTPFLAMEYVAGRELLEATRQLDLRTKLVAALRIAEGIEAAHSVSLAHGDLKPDNIMMTADNRPKILDFGLAKPVRENPVDESGQIAGTLHYLAPEQLAGGSSSLAGDLFAFGVVLYEILVESRPFKGDLPASVAYSILHEDPVGIRELDPELPEWLDWLVLALLAKRPADRPASITEAVNHLSDYLSAQSVTLDRELTGRSRSVTVIDLKNQSGDPSWDYFCEGFTDDIVGELSRRTEVVVSAQPLKDLPRDIKEVFKRYRSDFIITGSLMRHNEQFQLRLAVHGDGGERLVSSVKYEEHSDRLFEMLNLAVGEISSLLESETGVPSVEVTEELKTDISAYDYYLQAKSYYHTNKPEAQEFAQTMFDKALSINPDFAPARAGLADLQISRYMDYVDRSKDRLEEAKKQALRALEIDPGLPEGHRSLGRYYMFNGDLESAKGCFLKAIELNPKYAVGYRTLGWLKYQEGDFAASMEWAEKALQLAPTDTETLLLIGQLHTYGREYTAAVATLQRTLEIVPDYGRAYYNQGLVYMKLGVLEAAIENFEAAGKYQGDPNCFVDCGWAYFVKGDLDQARKAYTTSVEHGFFPFIAYYYHGFLERSCGNDDLARELCNRAVEDLKDVDYSDQGNVQVQGYYALALAGAGDRDSAHDQLDQILECNNLIGDVLYNVARCYSLLDSPRDAKMYLLHALNVSPGPTDKEVALDPHFDFLRD